MIPGSIATLRRLGLVFAAFLSLAPSMASAAPRYLVYVQHFPTGADPAPDTACPMGAEGRFLPGAYRAQIVFFPSDEQRGRIVEGRTLGERLPRPWGALGLAWATDGPGIGWLASLSYPATEDRSSADIRPVLAPPLWMAPSQKGAPPPLPPLLEAIFRPLLPQGSSADLLKLFCGTEHRSSTAGDGQLTRIHRILAHPAPDADDFAAVREFLLPGQAAPDVDSWKALLDKAASASPAAFVFADYLGDKVWPRHQNLYGRFVEGVRKWAVTTGPRETHEGGTRNVQGNFTTDNMATKGDIVVINSDIIALKKIIYIISGSIIFAFLIAICASIWFILSHYYKYRHDDTLILAQDDVLEPPLDSQDERLTKLEEKCDAMDKTVSVFQEKLDRIFSDTYISHDTLKAINSSLESLHKKFRDNADTQDDNLKELYKWTNKSIEFLRQDLSELRESLKNPDPAGERLRLPPTREAADVSGMQSLPPPEAPNTGRFGLAVNILGCEIPLGDAERQRLETAPSWREFGHRLVGEVLPIRTSHQTLGKIDAQLGEISNQSLRLIIPELNTRPQPVDSEKVAERPIERGVYGLITALLRPGLRIDGQVVRRAEVEVGA